jgi:hypothetical protein
MTDWTITSYKSHLTTYFIEIGFISVIIVKTIRLIRLFIPFHLR